LQRKTIEGTGEPYNAGGAIRVIQNYRQAEEYNVQGIEKDSSFSVRSSEISD